jgi:hypothetical protein
MRLFCVSAFAASLRFANQNELAIIAANLLKSTKNKKSPSYLFLLLLLHGSFCFRFRFDLQSVVEANGIEPMTPCLQSRCSTN